MKQNPERSTLKIGIRRKTLLLLVLLVASAFASNPSVSWGQTRNKPSLNPGTSAMTIVPPRGQRSGERSINQGSQPIAVVFANQTNENLIAHWIDLNGVGQELGSLVPGQSVEITTFPGHVTTFSSGSRRVATFRASTSSNAAYAILGTGGANVNMGQVTQFNPSFTGGQTGSAGTGLTLSDIGRLIKELAARKQSPVPGGGGIPGTNTGGKPGTNIGGNPGTNIGGNPGTNIGGNPRTNIGGNPGTNTGGNPGQSPIANTGSRLTGQQVQELLDLHNRVRAEVGVGPVTWDPAVAKVAQDYADKMAASGVFAHNQNNGGLGENIAMRWPNPTVSQLAGMWADEKKDWNTAWVIGQEPGNPQTGHYTQMVWRATTKIGAGIATGADGKTYLVCNYNPAGNMMGQHPFR